MIGCPDKVSGMGTAHDNA